MFFANVQTVLAPVPRSRRKRRAPAAPVYTAARVSGGPGEVWENGRDFNPVPPSATRAVARWRFDWGDRSTAAGREWLAWALHERLGLDRNDVRHAAAFGRLVAYLGGLPATGWTRTLDDIRLACRRPALPSPFAPDKRPGGVTSAEARAVSPASASHGNVVNIGIVRKAIA